MRWFEFAHSFPFFDSCVFYWSPAFTLGMYCKALNVCSEDIHDSSQLLVLKFICPEYTSLNEAVKRIPMEHIMPQFR